ncbi:FAS-associated factor 2 [Striga asiatica]|uniref:FAS-associated factor 2 n=1 Tax=Striga asiatica TaxID=4170 RepID=A0A5A7QKY5_STRAF|nr:FAS-associated factor 2 [Striga asiatica]
MAASFTIEMPELRFLTELKHSDTHSLPNKDVTSLKHKQRPRWPSCTTKPQTTNITTICGPNLPPFVGRTYNRPWAEQTHPPPRAKSTTDRGSNRPPYAARTRILHHRRPGRISL